MFNSESRVGEDAKRVSSPARDVALDYFLAYTTSPVAVNGTLCEFLLRSMSNDLFWCGNTTYTASSWRMISLNVPEYQSESWWTASINTCLSLKGQCGPPEVKQDYESLEIIEVEATVKHEDDIEFSRASDRCKDTGSVREPSTLSIPIIQHIGDDGPDWSDLEDASTPTSHIESDTNSSRGSDFLAEPTFHEMCEEHGIVPERIAHMEIQADATARKRVVFDRDTMLVIDKDHEPSDIFARFEHINITGLDVIVDGNSVPVTLCQDKGPSIIGPKWCSSLPWSATEHDNVLLALDSRTNAVYKFNDKNVDMRSKIERIQQNLLKYWYTDKAINEAIDKIQDLSKSAPSSWVGNRFYTSMCKILADQGLERTDVDLMLKQELFTNNKKVPRIIANEGPDRCVAQLLLITVIEAIYLERMGRHCIKHKRKEDVCDDICRQLNAKKNFCYAGKPRICKCCDVDTHAFECSSCNVKTVPNKTKRELTGPRTLTEIDQTAFDYSETFVPRGECVDGHPTVLVRDDGVVDPIQGLLSIELAIMLKVRKVIEKRCDWAGADFSNVVNDARAKPDTYKCRTKKGVIKVRLYRKVRNSGDRFTSVGNNLVEVSSALCSFTDNPEDFFTDRDVSGTYVFTTMPGQEVMPSPTMPLFFNEWCPEGFYLHIFIEGDDALLGTPRCFMDHAEFFVDRFHELGLNCKLFFRNGLKMEKAGSKQPDWVSADFRAEFCGIHFYVRDGRTVYNSDNKQGKWVPDILRALKKFSYTYTKLNVNNMAPAAEADAKLAFMIMITRAIEFGRVRGVANIFKTIADHYSAFIHDLHIVDLSALNRNDKYKVDQFVDHLDTYAIMYDKYDSLIPYSDYDQLDLLNSSLGTYISMSDTRVGAVGYSKMSSVNYGVTDDEVSFMALPKQLRLLLRPEQ